MQIRVDVRESYGGEYHGVKGLRPCGSLFWASIMGFRFKLTWTFIPRTLSSQKLHPGIGNMYCKVSGYAESWGLEGICSNLGYEWFASNVLGVISFKGIGV